MASGHITLEHGEIFITRWTGYELIVEIVIRELPKTKSGKELAEWLKTQLPQWEGHGPSIDLRGLNKNNRTHFWSGVEKGVENISELGEKYSLLKKEVIFKLFYIHKTNPFELDFIGETDDFLETENELIEKIGPGWKKQN